MVQTYFDKRKEKEKKKGSQRLTTHMRPFSWRGGREQVRKHSYRGGGFAFQHHTGRGISLGAGCRREVSLDLK